MTAAETGTRKANLGEGALGPLLFRYALPGVIAMLASALYNIVDQVFIGNGIGVHGNAATNVAFPLTTLCTAVALLLGNGAAANFNLAMGAGKKQQAAKIAGNAVTLLLLLGIFLCIGVRIFLEPLMHLFGATPDVLDYALTYTGITSFGFPFVILATGGSALIRSDGSPRYSMACMLSGAVINTILDPLLIFQFNMGMAGAALATVLGQAVSGVMALAYLLRFRSVKLQKGDFALSARSCGRIARLGASDFLNQLAMMLVQIVLNNTMTYYGARSLYGKEIPLACAGIISKAGMIFFSIIIGISQGMQPIAGFNYGAKKYRRVMQAYQLGITAASVISVCGFLCFQLFPRQIIALFGSGSDVYFQFAERYFRIYMFATFLNGIQPITSKFFSSIGKAPKGIFLALTRQFLFLLPLILILPLFGGIEGVMFAGPIADTVAALFSLLFIYWEFRRLRLLDQNKPAAGAC